MHVSAGSPGVRSRRSTCSEISMFPGGQLRYHCLWGPRPSLQVKSKTWENHMQPSANTALRARVRPRWAPAPPPAPSPATHSSSGSGAIVPEAMPPGSPHGPRHYQLLCRLCWKSEPTCWLSCWLPPSTKTCAWHRALSAWSLRPSRCRSTGHIHGVPP